MTKLFIYNYGITEVATFKTKHDACLCMQYFNDRLIAAHGALPERIFYYTATKEKGFTKVHVWASDINDHTLTDQLSKRDFINNLINQTL